ncbi:MAG: TetR/AcrR family transcriptional regulator [Acidimicrobiales bacterium]
MTSPADDPGGVEASNSRPPGRPRDPRLQEAIGEATICLLAEAGYEALTMEAVACRAGTTKAAIYRRWPSKAALVADVFASRAQSKVSLPDTGDLRTDLTAHIRAVIATLTGEPVGRAVLNVVVAGGVHPELAELLRSGFVRSRRHIVSAIVDAAAARGDLPPGADVEFAADVLLGPVYYRLLVSGDPVGPDLAPALVDLVVRTLHGASPQADSASDR